MGRIPRTLTESSDLSSDHSSLLLTVWADPVLTQRYPALIQGSMDWDFFRSKLEKTLSIPISLKTPHELEEAVDYFTKNVQEAAWASSQPSMQMSFLPRYPEEIRQLIREKRRARAVWQRQRLLTDKRHYNRLNNELKRLIRQYKQQTYETYLTNLTSKDGSLWRATRRLLRQPNVSAPLRDENGQWVITDDEKSEEFANYLNQVFIPCNNENPEQDEQIEEELSVPLPLSLPPPAFKPLDVINAIKACPNRKAPGYDLITKEVLQEMPRKAVVFLTTLYNSVLRTTHFPIQWKYSHITMIHKTNKPVHLASSYRPICLLPLFSKLLEKLLYKRIIIHLQDVLPDHQFGFRQNHSTIHQLHRVTDYIAAGLEQKLYTNAVFLDVSQAFDKVWYPGLLYKIKTILPQAYYLIIKSFLEDRFFAIRLASAISSVRPILAGVPQGSILAPLLYTIYTSDIPTLPNTLTATYADDIALLTSHKNYLDATITLQNSLDILHVWCKKWKITLNHNKSQHITFTLRRNTCPPLYLENRPIPQTDTVRYLGLTLDRRLTWKPHITNTKRTLTHRLKRLYTLLHRQSKLNMKQKLNIYTYLLKPIWTYGLQIFGTTKKTNLQHLQTFQSKILRLISSAPKFISNHTLHTDFNVPTIAAFAKTLYTRFHYKLHGHSNTLIRHMATLPDNTGRRLKRRWPRDLLG